MRPGTSQISTLLFLCALKGTAEAAA